MIIPEKSATFRCHARPAGRGVFRVLREGENVRTSGELADNADAGNGGCRFHGLRYRFAMHFRQAAKCWPRGVSVAHLHRWKRAMKTLTDINQNAPERENCGHGLVLFWNDAGASHLFTHERTKTMLIDQLELERARARGNALSSHYRAIGPAAIIAALMFQPQRKSSARAA